MPCPYGLDIPGILLQEVYKREQENYRVKAHLIVKPKKSPGKRDYVMIRLRGETCVVTPCSYANHTGEDRSEVWDNGTVLFLSLIHI